MNIGFVGLGQIGAEMVKRLREKDFAVAVYPRGVGLAEAKAAGATECNDYAKLAAQSDALILCVFTDEQMRDVLFNHGALAAMRPGSVLTIHVTGSPGLRQEIQDKAPKGVDVLDVTFSGSLAGVQKGALTLIAGGAVEALDRMRPLYDTYANKIFHVGKLGDGQVLKLLNNLVLASNMMNAAELLGAAERYGFDPGTVAQVIQTCTGASFAMSIFEHKSVEPTMTGAHKYMDKDIPEAVAAAKDVGMDLSAFTETVKYWRPK